MWNLDAMIELGFSLAIVAFENFCYFALADTFLRRRWQAIWVLPLATVCFVAVYVAVLLLLPFVPTTLVALLLLFLLVVVVYAGPLAVKAVLALFYWGLLSTVDYGIVFGGITLLKMDLSAWMNDPYYSSIVSIVAKLICFIIIFSIRAIWRKKNNVLDIDKDDIIYLMLVPVISVICLLMVANVYQQNQTLGIPVAIFGLVLFGVNMYTVKMLQTAARRRATKEDNRMLKQEVALGNLQLQTLTESQNNMREWAHEMKNHLQSIFNLLPEDADTVRQYVLSISDGLESDMELVNTRNTYFNAILNYKCNEMRRKDIVFSVYTDDFSEYTAIAPSDLVTLIGNTIDNAIEACQKNKGPREIDISLKNRSGVFTYAINNTVDEPLEDSAFETTSKQDAENHGIGLGNVRRAVDKYGGQCTITCQGNMVKFISVI